MGPLIIVFPDCFTALGGNQYVNSSAIGRYADYLTRELDAVRRRGVPHAREARASRLLRQVVGRLRLDDSRHEVRALLGRHREPLGRCVLRLRVRRRLAEHARRAREVPPAEAQGRQAQRRGQAAKAAGYNGRDDGRIARFLEHVWRKEKVGNGEVHALMNLAMAASYDPDPRAPNGFRVPYNLETGELLPERWQRWLRARPGASRRALRAQSAHAARHLHRLRLARSVPDPLRQPVALEGARPSTASPHVYEEFDDTHSGIDYRMERSLPFLYRALR